MTALSKPEIAAGMRILAEKTTILREAIPRGTRIGFVDYPMHMNVGDLLILLGALDFFQWNQNHIHASFCLFDQTSRAFDRLKECDVIVCHGGGNFGDIYPRHQKLRERLVECFPDKPIVIMPQSMHFSSAEAARESAAVFRKHRNLTIFVRDEHSLDLARSQFSDNVALCPDMAHRLFERLSAFARERKVPMSPYPLRLMRRDVEATAVSHEIGMNATVDWSDIVTTVEKARIWQHRAAVKLTGVLGGYNPNRLNAYSKTLSAIIPSIAERLIRHDIWLTSRLHGAIFGLLLERKVTLFDNSYGKNSRYFSLWGQTLVQSARLRIADAGSSIGLTNG